MLQFIERAKERIYMKGSNPKYSLGNPITAFYCLSIFIFLLVSPLVSSLRSQTVVMPTQKQHSLSQSEYESDKHTSSPSWRFHTADCTHASQPLLKVKGGISVHIKELRGGGKIGLLINHNSIICWFELIHKKIKKYFTFKLVLSNDSLWLIASKIKVFVHINICVCVLVYLWYINTHACIYLRIICYVYILNLLLL